jgi:fructose-bisphosphate aldolase class I
MDVQKLVTTVKALVVDNRGLLAIDESNATCNKRFAKTGILQTEETRRAYREMIITTPGLRECISGLILYDETIRQKTKNGVPFVQVINDAGMIPGIKVDTGAKDLANFPLEKITEGLDGLRRRLAEYAQMGARFAKWRAVITIGANIPSISCIEANAQALARYGALCQEAGILPIIEPEVLMYGTHTMQHCGEVTEAVLREVFNQLYEQRVALEGIILKPNMVLPGLACNEPVTADEAADATVNCLLRAVPAAVPVIAFLSGGQSCALASARLNAMNLRHRLKVPWALAFSFARAIQQPALEIWKGEEANVADAQRALYHRAWCNQAARLGQYSDEMEVSEHDKNMLAEEVVFNLAKEAEVV